MDAVRPSSATASRAVLGTMTFGDTVDLETAWRIVDAAQAAGVVDLDTANGYAGTASERIVGQIVAGRRDQFTIATKAGIYAGDAGGAPLLSEPGIRRSLEASLTRLGTDYVDLFYLHQPDRSVDVSETVRAIHGLIDEGLIRAYGVSNYSAWQISDIMAIASQTGGPRPVVAQQLYNVLARRIEDEYLEFAGTRGLRTVVYNPLAGGMLTGRHRQGEPTGDGRFGSSSLAAMYRDRYWNSGVFDAVARLQAIAESVGISLPALSLRWVISKPGADAVLLGGSKVEQLEANVAALGEGPLPAEVVAACDAATESLRGAMPAYNR